MTAQMSERLIYEGTEVRMNFCPPIPRHPSIVEAEEKGFSNTACWRGYVGTWEIKEGRFYLVSLNGRLRLEGEGHLFANWFTGVLRIPKGELLHYVHMGFGSVYEEELHIKIEKGIVTNTGIMDNRNKEHNHSALTRANLPGNENRFPGENEL